VLRILSPLKIHHPRPGLNPRILGSVVIGLYLRTFVLLPRCVFLKFPVFQGFGKADHEVTVGLLKKKYTDYDIAFSDEGY